MATTNSLNNRSAPFTVTAGDLTVTSGNVAITAATTSTVGQITQAGTRIFHTMGNQNTFVGSSAGNFTLTGSVNVGVGNTVMQNVTSGSNNTVIGSQAAPALTSGTANTGAGFQTFGSLTQGSDNTAFGYFSLPGITTGSRNTALGRNAGQAFSLADSDNITIGYLVTGTVGTSNSLTIGAGTGTGAGQLNKSFIHGIRGITTTNADAIAVLIDSAGQLGTVSSSIRFKENVHDLEHTHVLELRPVAFNYKQDGRKAVGLIAEEVEKVMPSLVAYNQQGEVESVKYQDLPVLLLLEIQKLRKRIEELEKK